jgi:hypothetical protein
MNYISHEIDKPRNVHVTERRYNIHINTVNRFSINGKIAFFSKYPVTKILPARTRTSAR